MYLFLLLPLPLLYIKAGQTLRSTFTLIPETPSKMDTPLDVAAILPLGFWRPRCIITRGFAARVTRSKGFVL